MGFRRSRVQIPPSRLAKTADDAKPHHRPFVFDGARRRLRHGELLDAARWT